MGVPNPQNRGVGEAGCLSHRARRPRRPGRRLFFDGLSDQPLDLVVCDPAWSAWARIIDQAIEPAADEAKSPLADRLIRNPEPLSHCPVVRMVGAGENNATP